MRPTLSLMRPAAVAAACAIGAAAVLAAAGSGCDRDDNQTVGQSVGNAVDRAGDAMQSGMKKTGEVIADGAQKAGDAVQVGAEKTAEAVGPAVDKAVDASRDAARNLLRRADRALADDSADGRGIYEALEETVEAAMRPDGLDNVVNRLDESDRRRLGDFAARYATAHESAARAARSAWQSAYGGSEFAIDNEQKAAVFRGAKLTVDKDSRYATVHLSADGRLPEVQLALTKEAAAWKIDLPDTATAEQLRDALAKRLQPLGDRTALPDGDAVAAKRLVARQVLAAFADVGGTAGGN